MKEILKYLGVVVVLLGVVVLVIHSMVSHPTNTYLLVGISLLIVGIITHIIINKRIK